MGKRERMSPVDTAWLRMDSPANLMMIVGIYLFEGAVDHARLRKVLLSRMASHPRFRSRVVQDPTGFYWELDDDFDIDQHLVQVGLPGRGTEADLQLFAGQMAAQGLDPTKPLWQMHLVDNYEGGNAMVVRIHHAIADGIALIGVLMAMTSHDAAHDAPPLPAPLAARDDKAEDNEWEAMLRPLTQATVRAIGTTGKVATRALSATGAMLDDPELMGEAATGYARVAAQVSKDALAVALMDDDSPTSLKGRPGGSKVVAWTYPMPLDRVKLVSKALGASINDVLLSCVAGAIRHYLAERGEDVDGIELRAMVPVNLRDPKQWQQLGNKFGLVPLLIPVGIANPLARLLEIRRRMAELKEGYTAVLTMGLLAALGMAPRAVQKQVSEILSSKATAVMTNVPGPQHALYMAGARILRTLFWVPQSGNIGVGVSILSYDGGVQFGLITDRKLCAQPQAIIDGFGPEFERLLDMLMLLPWDAPVDPEVAEQWLFGPVDGRATPIATARPRRPAKGPAGAAHPRRRARTAKAPARA